MSAIKLSSRYAKSLLDLAIDQNKLEKVYEDVVMLVGLLNNSAELRNLLKSPIINPDKKGNILKTLLEGKVDELTLGFISILVRKSREKYLHEVVNAFVFQYNQYKHITTVTLRSATELSEDARNTIVNQLKEKAKLENVALTTKVDEELIGGFVLQFDNKQMDASVARQLRELEKDFLDNKFIKQL